jgi:MFS family permease
VISLLMMGSATFAIGLLPGYDAIGVLAPVLLVLLRLIQGFGLGGEWGGAVLIVSEYGDPARRGYWASWP